MLPICLPACVCAWVLYVHCVSKWKQQKIHKQDNIVMIHTQSFLLFGAAVAEVREQLFQRAFGWWSFFSVWMCVVGYQVAPSVIVTATNLRMWMGECRLVICKGLWVVMAPIANFPPWVLSLLWFPAFSSPRSVHTPAAAFCCSAAGLRFWAESVHNNTTGLPTPTDLIMTKNCGGTDFTVMMHVLPD